MALLPCSTCYPSNARASTHARSRRFHHRTAQLTDRIAASGGSTRLTPACGRASGPRTRTTHCVNSTPSLGHNGRKSVSVKSQVARLLDTSTRATSHVSCCSCAAGGESTLFACLTCLCSHLPCLPRRLQVTFRTLRKPRNAATTPCAHDSQPFPGISSLRSLEAPRPFTPYSVCAVH